MLAGQFALQPGDVVLTGTPAGVGPLQAGDELLMALRLHRVQHLCSAA